MSIEVLNTQKVRSLIEHNGWRFDWVIQKIGEKRSLGYVLLRDGRLPKDAAHKARVLKNLSKLLGVEAGDLLLTLVAKRTAS
jgi:hypothetical protein